MRILVDFHRIISDLGISRCEYNTLYTLHFFCCGKKSAHNPETAQMIILAAPLGTRLFLILTWQG